MKYSNRHISDDELDKLFRDAHASEGPESLFVPEFWSEMEAMMPAEEKARRSFYWIPLSAAVVVISILLFYPANPAEISALKQNGTVVSKNELKPETAAQIPANSNSQEESASMNGNKSIVTQNRTNTTFRIPKKQDQTNPDQVQDVPVNQNPGEPMFPQKENETPSNATNLGMNNPGSVGESTNDLDSIWLEPRNEPIIHDEVAGLPKKSQRESNQWYVELGPTVGQSPYMSPDHKRNSVGGAIMGGGYTKRIENAFVSFGLQARMEGFGGLEYRETNFTQNIVRTVSVKQLYSLELPVKFGYTFNHSELAFGVVPGVQLFIHGKEKITQNQVVQREDSYTGKVEHSNSLSMEFGLQYYYNLSSKYSIGAKLNADILRPFHTDYYLGKLSGFPVNGQIVIRRTFSK